MIKTLQMRILKKWVIPLWGARWKMVEVNHHQVAPAQILRKDQKSKAQKRKNQAVIKKKETRIRKARRVVVLIAPILQVNQNRNQKQKLKRRRKVLIHHLAPVLLDQVQKRKRRNLQLKRRQVVLKKGGQQKVKRKVMDLGHQVVPAHPHLMDSPQVAQAALLVAPRKKSGEIENKNIC